jgi:hypothetical protein
MRWIKLYPEMMSNYKIASLSDRLHRRMIECLLFADDYDGVLPPLEDMAWYLRCDVDELRKELDELVDRIDGFAREGEVYVVDSAAVINYPMSASERGLRYRAKSNKQDG